MANSYGCDGMTSAMAERAMGLDRELTTREQNEIERRLEDKAEWEARWGTMGFREWLLNDANAMDTVEALACAVCGYYKYDDVQQGYIAEHRNRLIAEYVRYRVNTFTDDERAEVEREVIGEEA